MASTYRRPGVYLEERLQTSPFESANATAVAVFVGIAAKGDAMTPVRVDSWTDFAQQFGGFSMVPFDDGTTTGKVLSYLPYAVYSYYQNGGRAAYIVRILPAAEGDQGSVAEVTITDNVTPTPGEVFTVTAKGAGAWGNSLEVVIVQQALDNEDPANMVFGIAVLLNGAQVETFNNLSMKGVAGTRDVMSAVNDPRAGSQYIALLPPATPTPSDPKVGTSALTGGIDPDLPVAADLISTDLASILREVEGPLLISIQPFQDATSAIVMPPAQSVTGLNDDREDIFMIWDGNPVSLAGANYPADAVQRATNIGTDDSYAALYCPWIITPDPATPGRTLAIPPSGAVAGTISRIDATQGVWRAPAGIPASLTNAIGTETKFSDTDQGELNYKNVNVIRAVVGAGICVMGARTRKLWGADRYVNGRRTLIYIKETLRRATQFAVFENNDERLWSALRSTAQRILQPMWEQGGLKGTSPADAYFIRCDATINTPQVIQSGEVRMEIGVALQYPAEFVVIRISQFDSGSSFVGEITAAP